MKGEGGMRVLIGLMLAMALAAPALAQETAGVPHNWTPGPDTRPQIQKDWEAAMERSLTINPEPWELVWPKAWTALAEKAEPPLTTAQIHASISKVAWAAYGLLSYQVHSLEGQERAAQAACAEQLAKGPDAAAGCAVPCRGPCPAGLTPAERAAQDRRARIEMAQRKMARLRELAEVSQARLAWKKAQGDDVDKPAK
jgi:hypothetical protein